jgi:hypothetical protein
VVATWHAQDRSGLPVADVKLDTVLKDVDTQEPRRRKLRGLAQDAVEGGTGPELGIGGQLLGYPLKTARREVMHRMPWIGDLKGSIDDHGTPTEATCES